MTKIIYYLLLILLFNNCQHKKSDPSPISISRDLNSLNDVVFIDSLNGIMCGGKGNIMYTKDGGINWIFRNTDLKEEGNYANDMFFYDIFSLDKNTAWACGALYEGKNAVYKTTNGGKDWIFYPVNNSSITDIFVKIQFTDSLNGYAISAKAFPYIIYYSILNCYGSTYNNQPVYQTSNIAKTIDGGKTWKLLPKTFNAEIYSMYFTDKNNGTICGENHQVFKTTDGGETWNTCNITYHNSSLSNDSMYNFTDILFTSTQNGIMISSSKQNHQSCFKTSDGGSNWEEIGLFNQFQGGTIYNLSFPILAISPANKLIMYEDSRRNSGSRQFLISEMYKSEDGGYNWIPIKISNANGISYPESSYINGISFIGTDYLGVINYNVSDNGNYSLNFNKVLLK